MRIAIIASSPRPIPAVEGGATQTMITNLLDVNERQGEFEFIVFNYFNSKAVEAARNYVKSRFFFYQPKSIIDKTYSILFRGLRKLTSGAIPIKSRFVNFCASHLKDCAPEIVLIEGNYFQVTQLRRKICSKIPIILHIHIDGLFKGLDIAERVVKDSSGIITISEFCRNRVLEIAGSNESQVKVLKNCIDTEHFVRVNNLSQISELRMRYGISEKQKLIIYCGRIHPGKGLDPLLDAIKSLDSEKYVVMLIGSSAYKGSGEDKYMVSLRNKAAKCGPKVIFTGYVDQTELPLYYSASDVFVLPSICNEAAGNVTIEAMACGIPAVVSTQGGIPEYADLSACIHVKYDDYYVANLKKAILSVAENDALRNKLKSNSRRIAVKYDKYEYYRNFQSIINSFSEQWSKQER